MIVGKPSIGIGSMSYPDVEQYLDSRYGGPEKKDLNRLHGEILFRDILRHLSVKKDSTCEDIAAEIQDVSSRHTRLKSTTDNIRKFIRDNLLPLRVVEVSGHEKRANKKIAQFSLTPLGVLYVIHLFTRTTSDSGKENIVNYDLQTIRNVAIEYRTLFPKVFGRDDFFKDVIGPDYEYALGLPNISDGFDLVFAYHTPQLLNDSINFLYLGMKNELPHDSRVEADQISLMIYNNMLDNLEIYELRLRRKKNTSPEEVRQARESAATKWKKIVNSDPEIRKWYNEFIHFSIENYGNRMKEILKLQEKLHD